MDRIRYIKDPRLRKMVAVKCTDTAAMEYETLMRFDHPGIIRPIEMKDGCIILPYMPERGADGIAGYCSEKHAWKFMKDLAESLSHIHGLGYVHGDITPANILISEDRFIICDFDKGDDSISMAYTPPEWDRHRSHLTPKSDIWSLGASVFNLLMGIHIFSGRGGKEQTAKTPIPALRTDRYSKTLSDLVKACLNHDPMKRPGSDEIIKIAEKELSAGNFRRQEKKKADVREMGRDTFWPEEMTVI